MNYYLLKQISCLLLSVVVFATIFPIAKTLASDSTELYSTSLFGDGNLVSYYQMEGNANDSKSSNNGTSTSITYNSSNGKFNQGAGFGGSSYISIASNSGLNPSQISIAFWLQIGSLDADSVPTSKWWSDPNSWVMYIDGSGSSGFTDKIRFNVIVNEQAPSWNLKATSNNALTTATWYHVVGTYDGSTVKLYINGVLQSETTSISGTIRSGSNNVKISGWGSTGYMPNGSKVDDYAIFNRALTATEVDYLYNGTWPDTNNNIQDFTYTYDANGNILQIVNSSITNASSTISYTYDNLNRLTNASTTVASTTPFNYSYTYDALGNMLTRVENGTTTTYTYATNTPAYLNPHAIATTTGASTIKYAYDNNGNLTSTAVGATTTAAYTWDYNNRMTQAVGNSATSTYSYDPWGQRVKMTVATTSSATTYYPTKEYNITGSVPTKNIFLPDGTLIATIVGTGATTTISYIHTDHLGGMNVATSDISAIQQLSDYLPYGNTRIDEQNGFASQRKFANYEFDPTSNLNYVGQRYYNGTNAKFLSQDPVFLAIGDNGQVKQLTNRQLQQLLSDPQALNSYAYSRNNPLRYYDPNGQWFEEALSWINARTGIGQRVDNSSVYNYAVEHPVQGGIAVGLGSGLALVGGSYLAGVGYTGLGIGADTAVTVGSGTTGACVSGGCQQASRFAERFSDFVSKYGPTNAQKMVEVGDKFSKAGIDIADHALLRTAQRASPEQVINTYQQGAKYLDTLYNNTNIFKDGLRLSIDGAGKIITVIEQKAMNPARFTPLK